MDMRQGVGAARAMTTRAAAAGCAQSKIGAAAAAGLAGPPGLRATAVPLLAIPQTIAILGSVVAAFITTGGS